MNIWCFFRMDTALNNAMFPSHFGHNVCSRSSDPIYIISHKMKWSLFLGHLLGASEVTANIYCKCIDLYLEGYVIFSI